MRSLLFVACCLAALPLSWRAQAQERASYEKLVATHARANLVPEALVHRVIVRESKYHPDLIGRGGTIGLMQIKLGTARGVGYKGDAEGLRDPDTNLAYGVKYLAGAYRAANGDHDRAVKYFASGYYHVAKQQRLERIARGEPALASAPPKDVKPAAAAKGEGARPEEVAAKTSDTPREGGKDSSAESPDAHPDEIIGQVSTPKADRLRPAIAPPGEITAIRREHTGQAAKPKHSASIPKAKKLADARAPVPRPPAAIPGGANVAKPR